MFPTTIRRVDEVPADQREVYTSTWFLTIGTHTKPASDNEFGLLSDSLSDVIRRVVNNGDVLGKCLYPIHSVGGRVTELRNPVFRTQANLGIVSAESIFAVERGGVQGRVDAHIVCTVKHRNRIRFDIAAFREIIKEELIEENLRFIARGIPSESKADEHLSWAGGNPYCTFRLIGRDAFRDALEYINKSYKPQTTPTDQTAFINLVSIAGTRSQLEPVPGSPAFTSSSPGLG